MKKMIVMTIGALALLGIVGCGGPESEYEKLLDKAVKLEMMDKAAAKKSLEEFKAMTPEKQQAEIKRAKIWTAAAEAAK